MNNIFKKLFYSSKRVKKIQMQKHEKFNEDIAIDPDVIQVTIKEYLNSFSKKR